VRKDALTAYARLQWILNYNPTWLFSDIIAGLTVRFYPLLELMTQCLCCGKPLQGRQVSRRSERRLTLLSAPTGRHRRRPSVNVVRQDCNSLS